MMAGVIRQLLEMLRLRSGPQELPAQPGLTLALAIAYIGQGFVAGRVLDEPDAAPRTILAIAVQFGIIAMLLNLKRFPERINQTISALAGTGLIFGLASIALLSRLQPGEARPDIAAMYLVLFVWSLLVDAHIYRHALPYTMSMGILLSVSIFAANMVLLQVVFG